MFSSPRLAFLLSCAAALLLAGCAQAPSQRLVDTAAAVQAVRVYVWSPGDGAFTGASRDALLATLSRNGLTVSGLVVLDRPLPDLGALASLWASIPFSTPASHALVLTAQGQATQGQFQYQRFEAVAWEAATQRLVWKSTLASMTQPAFASRSERLAADLLRGLAREGLLPPASGAPRDAQGQDIPPTRLPIQLQP